MSIEVLCAISRFNARAINFQELIRPSGMGTVPVVLFFFGGLWNSGNRADYRFVGEALTSRGAVL
jgi:carboxylesterase type B